MGSAVVARLHADPQFRRDMDAARTELAMARARGVAVPTDCDAIAAALAQPLPAAAY